MLVRAARRAPVRLELAAVVAVAAAGAGVVGWIAGGGGDLPILLLVVAAGTFLVLRRPFVGLLLLVATIPLESLVVVDGATGVRLLGGGVLAAWFLRKVARRESWKGVFSSPLLLGGSVFALLALASALWSPYPDAAIGGFFQLARLLAFTVLIDDLVDSWSRLDRMAKALAIGVLVAALLTIFQMLSEGRQRAGGGIAGNINTTSVVLVTVLPLGFYLLRASPDRRWRLFSVPFLVIVSLAVVLTLSRMNLLLLPLLLLAMLLHMTRRERGRRWIPLLLIAGALASSAILPDLILQRRTESILPYLGRTVSRDGQVSSPRGFHLRAGLAMLRDHPVLGVGHNAYPHLFRHRYQLEVAGAPELYLSERNAHSSHVAILAEMGLLGFGAWLFLLVGIGVRHGWLALRRTRGSPEGRGHVLAQMLMYGLLLHVLAFGFYYENQQEKILWTLLAMAVAASRVARLHPTDPPPDRIDGAGPDHHPGDHASFGVRI